MAATILALLAGALVLWQQPWQRDADASAPSIPADAPSRLTAQLRALSAATTEQEFVEAAGTLPAAQEFGRRTWDALRSVGQGAASFRYISGGEVPDRADGSTTASVEVSWTPTAESGLGEDKEQRSSVLLRVTPQSDGDFSIIAAQRRVGPVPVWLVGAIDLSRSDGGVVVRVGGGDAGLPIETMASTARAAVVALVPDLAEDLTIISPRSQDEMATIVGHDRGAVEQIAAVTVRLGGASSNRPVIVLNPTLFATMDRRAAQIVLSHEATHALTGAVGTSAADWLVEGFADYVALRRDDAPLTVSAGQVLAEVKAGRLPDALPTDGAFDATTHGLGAVYESAWLIFRMLGEQHADADLVRFYLDVVSGQPVEEALQASFGLTLDSLTAQWRDYLTKSASTVS